ncbi:MAG: SBBP repeat-containing protein [Bacteroidia bacterium]|jgi:gliding motility-associated-like protein
MRRLHQFSVYFLIIALGAGFSSIANTALNSKKTYKCSFENKTKKLGLKWVENHGQYPKEVAYYSKTFAGEVFVTHKSEIVYQMQMGVTIKEIPIFQTKVAVKGINILPTKMNYFMHNDSKYWQTNLSVFQDIDLGELWKGIRLELHAYGNNIEKLFCIEPRADISKIKMEVTNAHLSITCKGELCLRTSNGKMSFTKPIAWQLIDGVKIMIPVCYKLKGQNQYSFKMGNYDNSYPLFIDPLLSSTFLGGSLSDKIHAIAMDDSGNVYVAGATSSPEYPFNNSSVGSAIFVAKLNPDLSLVLASTLVGNGNVNAITLDIQGNVLITGKTSDDSFPVVGNPYDNTYNGASDVFVLKLSNDLDSIIASTFVGGDKEDDSYKIVVDNTGNVFLTGTTKSLNFPVTTTSFDTSFNGITDAFIAKLSADLSTLQSATFIGGINSDIPGGLAVDVSGDVLISGQTSSIDYPVNGPVYGNSRLGGDIFISRLDNHLTRLIVSTLIGGTIGDGSASICIDKSGDVIIAGTTSSSNYPVTQNAFDPSHNGGPDVVISRFNANLSQLKASTFLGGTGIDGTWAPYGQGITTDKWGNIWVTGQTRSSGFPTSNEAYDKTFNGGNDGFVSELSGDLSSLMFSTYLGGSLDDEINSIVIDISGNIIIGGATKSSNYPTTGNSFDSTFNNGNGTYFDGIVSKLGFYKSISEVKAISFCQGDSAFLQVNVIDGVFNWNNGTHARAIYTRNPGIYTCFVLKGDSIRLDTFVVTAFLPTSHHLFDTLCLGDQKTLSASGSPEAFWEWNTNDTTRQIAIVDSGLYTVIVRDTSVCAIYDSFYIALQKPVLLDLIKDTIVCEGSTITISAWRSEYDSYSWNTGAKEPSVVIKNAGLFKVVASNRICIVTDSIEVATVPKPELFLPNDTIVCFRDLSGIILDAGDWNSYYWYPTGERVRSIYATYPEIYIVTVTESHHCDGSDTILVEDVCPGGIYIPNSFTPNKDGINDVFFVRGIGIKYMDLTIYNRWGEQVFHTTDILSGWDGSNNNVACPTDSYFYLLRYMLSTDNSYKEVKNILSLIR